METDYRHTFPFKKNFFPLSATPKKVEFRYLVAQARQHVEIVVPCNGKNRNARLNESFNPRLQDGEGFIIAIAFINYVTCQDYSIGFDANGGVDKGTPRLRRTERLSVDTLRQPCRSPTEMNVTGAENSHAHFAILSPHVQGSYYTAHFSGK